MKNHAASHSQRQVAQTRVDNARSRLLMMLLLTAGNVALLLTGSTTMFLFSATIPYFAAILGSFHEYTFLPVAGPVIAAALLALYFLCWLLSKKRPGWLIVALVLFFLDCLCLAAFYAMFPELLDVLNAVLHLYILYYLFAGAKSGFELKKTSWEAAAAPTDPTGNSTPLRIAELDEKYRVLLEDEQLGHKICYRRMKAVNQLVIDGYIYDEVKMVMEPAHALSAVLDGHVITVGYDGNKHSYLSIDGQLVLQRGRAF